MAEETDLPTITFTIECDGQQIKLIQSDMEAAAKYADVDDANLDRLFTFLRWLVQVGS